MASITKFLRNVYVELQHFYVKRFSKEIGLGSSAERRLRAQSQDDLVNLIKEFNFLKNSIDQHSIVSWTDAKGVITKVNENFVRISGYSEEELVGANHSLLNSGYHPKSFFNSLWEKISSGQVWHGVIRNKCKDGSYYWVTSTILPHFDAKRKITGYIGIRTDITDQFHLEDSLKSVRLKNSFTGLPNLAGIEIKQVKDKFNNEFYVLIVSIKNFDKVLLTLGEKVAKVHLQNLIKRFCSELPRTLVFSFKNDVICVAVKKRDAKYTRQLIFQILNEENNKTKILETRCLSLSIADQQDLKSNIALALTYKSKVGSDGFIEVDPSYRDKLFREFSLEMSLEKAFDNEEFYFEIQPVVNPANVSVVGGELLLRWQSSRFGKVYPNEFIHLLSETDTINKVTIFAIKKACKLIKLYESKDFYLSVNVTASQISSKEFFEDLIEVFEGDFSTLSRLKLEITESAKIVQSKQVIQNISHFKALGGEIMMDDFGTGYASLETFNNFDFDYIKIDKTFVDDIEKLSTKAQMLDVITSMCDKFDKKVVFEGVENKEQLRIIGSNKNALIQGFYFFKPLSVESFLEKLDS